MRVRACVRRQEAAERLFRGIRTLIFHSLKACQVPARPAPAGSDDAARESGLRRNERGEEEHRRRKRGGVEEENSRS